MWMRYFRWLCGGGGLGATTGGLSALCALAFWSRWMARPMTEAEAGDFEFLALGVTLIATGVGALIGAAYGLILVWLRASDRVRRDSGGVDLDHVRECS
jgi:ribose/xylose/arabinose/galactoside ABC-type transport system permease subunit